MEAFLPLSLEASLKSLSKSSPLRLQYGTVLVGNTDIKI